MGSVYKAEHTTLGKLVAVKVLRTDLLANEITVKRFDQEARTTGKLAHPNLVSVHDYGVADDGAPYLVMDYVEGRGLAEIIKAERRVEFKRVIEIFMQLCDALAWAHSNSVLHRDLKPGNIIVRQGRDGGDWVKIVDFGIAKFLSSVQGEQCLTLNGEVCGSPLYMSPEQCMGHRLDARSDIYALACVMYEALTGSPPFAGESPMQTMYMHIHEPAARFGSQFKHIPAALEAIVLHALEKNVEDRYQSMLEMKADLQQVKDGERPHRARPQRWFNRKEVRNRLILYPSALMLGCWLGVSAGILHSFDTLLRPSPWKKLSNTAVAQMREGNTDLAEHFYLKALGIAQAQQASDTEKANIVAGLADLYLGLSTSEGGSKSRQTQALREFECAASMATHDRRLLGYVLEREGDCLYNMGLYGKAEDTYERALSVRSEGAETYEITVVLMKMGKNLLAEGDFAKAKPLLIRCSAMQQRVIKGVHPDTSTCLSLLGQVYEAENQLQDADKAYKEAIEEREKLSGTQTRMLQSMLKERADVLRKLGQAAKAKKLDERLEAIAQ